MFDGFIFLQTGLQPDVNSNKIQIYSAYSSQAYTMSQSLLSLLLTVSAIFVYTIGSSAIPTASLMPALLCRSIPLE